MQTETYFDNIQAEIIEKLHSAQDNIRVAVAWFTDGEIIAQLAEIALRGVDVQVVVADHEVNRKVDYSPMIDQGVTVLFYPAKGYGMMHHKFCVVDEQLVVNGSYNWTVNAKKNNGENIHIITDRPSVQQFLDKFETLKNDCLGIANDEALDARGVEKSELEQKASEIEDDFEEEWNIYLNSKVANYDKEELSRQGKAAAEYTHGNAEVIPSKMNMIYQSIIEDTEIDKKEIEKLKGRLENKIDNYQNSSHREAEEKKSTTMLQTEATRKTLSHQIYKAEERIKTLTNDKNSIIEDKIPAEENKILTCKEEIETAKQDISLPTKRRRIWGEALLLFILSAYLFLFYSSVIYTILYGKADAFAHMRLFGELPEMEVFNSQALSLAMEKGLETFLFISLFTVLPFVFGFLFHSIKDRKGARWFYILSAFVLDVLLAYLIAQSVHELQYLSGQAAEPWHYSMALSIARFWVVLVLGFVPYLAWGALYEYISKQLDDSSRNVNHHRIKQRIKSNKDRIKEIEGRIEELKQEHVHLGNQIIGEETTIQQLNSEIYHLEYEQKLRTDKIEQDLNLIQQKLDNQKDKILAYLDRDQVPVSRSIFKDRVTAYMSGWEAWLYSFYNRELADKKIAEAQLHVETWTEKTFRNGK